MTTIRSKIIKKWQEGMMDGIKIGDRDYLIKTDFLKIKKEKIDTIHLNEKTKKLYVNVVRRAKYVCEKYPAEATEEISDGLISEKELAVLLNSVIVDYGGQAGSYKIFDGQQNVASLMQSLTYGKFKNDDGRIKRYWEFCALNGKPLDPELNENQIKIMGWAKNSHEIAQDLFEEILKWNDVAPEKWRGVFDRIDKIVSSNDPFGPPTPRFP